jgi:DNA polymerase elongation subunit (family B)
MDFYTNVAIDGNHILYRGISNGKRIQRKVSFKPKLYLKSQNKNTLWHTLKGEPLEEKIFPNIYEARAFVKRYLDVDGFDIYGNQKYLYSFLADTFPDNVEVDTSLVKVATIDIEVNTSNGNPDLKKAEEFINAITVRFGDEIHAFGLKKFDPSKYTNVIYHQSETESDLLLEFLEVWTAQAPDIVTGWNIKVFDIPYILNRIILVLGHEAASTFSPWKMIESKMVKNDYGGEEQTYNVVGLAILDYIELYKKFSPTPNQERYSLEHISTVELEEHKVDYESLGYKNLHDLYTRNYQLFIEYNIQDVNLVCRIEEKLLLIELAVTLATRNHVNYEDVFFQVRMWDSIVNVKLQSKHIALPPHHPHSKSYAFEGAYVKEANPGRYRWLASFDLNSLYPHLIMMYNLSPETLLDPDEYDDLIKQFKRLTTVNVTGLMNKEFDLSFLKSRNVTMTPNGQFFRTDIKGFMPELMEDMFNARKEYKDKMLDAKRHYKDEIDPEKKAVWKKKVSSYQALQSAYKVTLNSCYGVLGSPWFRLFDIRIAEAITMSGQLSIRWILKDINDYFNKILKTTEKDFVIGADTDSLYLSMDEVVNTFLKDTKNLHKTIDFMNKICEDKIKIFISNSYQNLTNYVNAYEQKMVMKRENIMDQAIWVGKKNYITSICIDEAGSNFCDEPYVKVTGLQAVKSSTPKFCKEPMNKVISLMLRGTEEQVVELVDRFHDEFKKRPIQDIASPRGVKDIGKYVEGNTLQKGAPIHVRAAFFFNQYLKKHGLDKQYELIRDRDKIRYTYLKSPNPFQSHVMGFLDKIPPEMGLDSYIDIETQFDKVFKDPVQGWLNAIGWKIEKTESLDSFFG